MHRLIYLLIFLTAGIINAKYVPPSLPELILKADKILYGKIVCVDKSVIELSVYNSINYDSKSITINKFQEWNCGKRWRQYAVGDYSLFFIELKNGRYRPMGGGNEGELPIHDEKIYVHASTISTAGYTDLFNRSDRQMEDYGYNNPYNGYVLVLSHFWRAIVLLKKCFTSEVNIRGNLVNVQQRCDDSDYESAIKQNKILSWALQELKI